MNIQYYSAHSNESGEEKKDYTYIALCVRLGYWYRLTENRITVEQWQKKIEQTTKFRTHSERAHQTMDSVSDESERESEWVSEERDFILVCVTAQTQRINNHIKWFRYCTLTLMHNEFAIKREQRYTYRRLNDNNETMMTMKCVFHVVC